jgi:pimeloyl-ACP methyl ester carboxylesterase
MLWIILPLILIAALIFGLDMLIGRMYRYDRQVPRVTPAKFDLPFDEIRIPMAGDAYLAAWWIPSKRADAPTLVLLHGWGRNRARMMPHIQKLHPLGYNLLVFDARNHGASSDLPRPNVGTFTEDLLAAVDFAARNAENPAAGIGVFGLSIGGGAAVSAAGQDARIRCAVTVGAISHPVAVMRYGFERKGIPDFIGSLLLGYMRLRYRLDFEKIAPLTHIPRAEGKILLIHGDQDDVVPLKQAQDLAAAGDPQKVQLWVVPGKGHSNCNTHPEFWPRVTDFLKDALPLPGM